MESRGKLIRKKVLMVMTLLLLAVSLTGCIDPIGNAGGTRKTRGPTRAGTAAIRVCRTGNSTIAIVLSIMVAIHSG